MEYTFYFTLFCISLSLSYYFLINLLILIRDKLQYCGFCHTSTWISHRYTFFIIAIHFFLMNTFFASSSLFKLYFVYNCDFAVYSEKCRKSNTAPAMDIVYPRSPFCLLPQGNFPSWFLWHQGMNESKTIFSLISGKVFISYRKWGQVEPKSKGWEIFTFFFISSSHWIIILNVFWVLFLFYVKRKNARFPMSR